MGTRLTVTTAEGVSSAEYKFDQKRVVIGRGAGADVRLPHRTVSQNHALVEMADDGLLISDLGSTNGTFIGGNRLLPHRPHRMDSGSHVLVGKFSVKLEGPVPVKQPTSWEVTSELSRSLMRDLMSTTQTELISPTLTVLDSDSALELRVTDRSYVIGRDAQCDLPINDSDASRRHAEVVLTSKGAVLSDLQSKNGTKVNGRLVDSRKLRHEDVVQIGTTRMRFEDAAEPMMATIESEPDVRLDMARSHGEEDDRRSENPEIEAPQKPTRQTAGEGAERGLVVREAEADLFIYAMAGLIFVASLIGLFILMRASG